MNEAKTVLITGASSGIGKELAGCFAQQGYRVVMVSANAPKLEHAAEAIRAKTRAEVLAVPVDLSQPRAAEELYRDIRQRGLQVDVLVNNAGIGQCGAFVLEEAWREMIAINITSLTELMRLFAHDMAQAGQGRILNVASTGAYQPGPYIAVYYATKAYVLSLTQAVRRELKGSGVTVSALCPGATATEFSRRAGKSDIKGAMSAQKVAQAAFKGLMRGRAVIIPGGWNKAAVVMSKVLPSCISAAIVERIQNKQIESFRQTPKK
ncbi:SDR family NAD(P)-dependent oxidoreductase [Acetanaerobacterium elongatum]|uniref:Short-chain dehydrogenase n=1 Tax=Acetanaerobacterium elongatum TaxID=258515 RepID=A0A1H0G3U6_9FIRM|nr:SDR family oxidoreductase [Acetanaerobacterium elongatum]SDO01532.1 hypothetical protein SAMN05192585_14710 [Acetanaerobacterium elongatum]